MKLTPGVHFILTFALPAACIPLNFATLFLLIFNLRNLGLPLTLLLYVLTSVAIGFVIVFINHQWVAWTHRSGMRRLSAQSIPGPKGDTEPGCYNILGRLDKKDLMAYPGEAFDRLKRQHGDVFNVDLLSICTDNPYYITRILTTQFPNFIKGMDVQKTFDSFLGKSVLNVDGGQWLVARTRTSPFFAKDVCSDLRQHTERVLSKIKEGSETGMAVDLQDLIQQYATDVSSSLIFGKSLDMLSTPLLLPGEQRRSKAGVTPGERFSAALSTVSHHIAHRSRCYAMPWQLSEIMKDGTAEGVKTMSDYLDPIVDAALAGNVPGGTVLWHLVFETHDRKIIRDELLGILSAARDPMASALTFVLYFLATHPHVLARLRKEILDVLGPSSSSSKPTPEPIKDLKYLHAVINESLRLLPPIPFVTREAVKGTVLSDDPRNGGARYFVPGKAKVAMNIMSMHRREDVWGADALDFAPERWLEDDERYPPALKKDPSSVFMPFLAGPRMCPGRKIAMDEIAFFLIRFVQTFEHVELAPDAQPEGTLPPAEWREGDPKVEAGRSSRKVKERIWPKVDLAMYSHGGFWARVR